MAKKKTITKVKMEKIMEPELTPTLKMEIQKTEQKQEQLELGKVEQLEEQTTIPEQEPTPELESHKLDIPKEDVKAQAPREHFTVDVAEPNAVAPQEQVLTQLSVDEAVAEAMTKGNPMSYIRGLAKEHRLREVTATFKALEDLGHK